MRKTVCLWMCLVFLVIGPAQIGAQEFKTGLEDLAALFPPVLSAVTGLGLGNVKVTSSAGVGGQWLGMSFNMPAFDQAVLQLPASIDLRVKGGRFWVGSVRVDASISDGLCLFLKAEGNLRRDVTIATENDPIGQLFANPAATWTGSGVQWWMVDGGISYPISNQVSIMGGLKRDYISLRLRDPRDASGTPIDSTTSLGGGTETIQEFGDFTAGLWIPYLGLRFNGTNQRISLSASPYTRATVQLPDCFFWTISVPPAFLFRITNAFEYSVSRPGGFVEGTYEYDYNLNPNAMLRLWGKGNYTKIRGSGNLDEVFHQVLQVQGQQNQIILTGSENSVATFIKSTLSAGLSAVVVF